MASDLGNHRRNVFVQPEVPILDQEATDSADGEFGQQRLENLLIDAQKRSINEILARVEQETRQHRGDVEAADDATMLVLKFGN